jgi:hypothetical protein
LEDIFTVGVNTKIIYERHNKQGDAIYCEGVSKNFGGSDVKLEKFDNDYKEKLNNYLDYCHKKGIKVYFSFPPVKKTSFIFKEQPETVAKIYQDTFPSMGLLNTPSETLYEDNFFYDSPYHLNLEGREKHTKFILSRIKLLLDAKQPSHKVIKGVILL